MYNTLIIKRAPSEPTVMAFSLPLLHLIKEMKNGVFIIINNNANDNKTGELVSETGFRSKRCLRQNLVHT